jgi:dihydroorotase
MEAFHGLFYISGEFRDKYVVVEDGKIKEIKDEISGVAIRTIPGHILPGGVDMHVHFRDPGETHKEDFQSGSLSAVFGGTTTVCDMPNNVTPIIDSKSFHSKLNAIGKRSLVDFGLYQAASPNVIPESIGEKIFLGKSTGGLLTDVEKCSWSDKVKVVHAELQSCLENNRKAEDTLISHDASRPLECEMAAIEEIFKVNLSHIHIAHLTAVRTIQLAKSLGFTTEVTPHHLLLNNSSSLGPLGKVNPPLRKRSVQEDMLGNLDSNAIDVIASDHAPHTLNEKGNFPEAPSGLPGVETRVPLILALYKKHLISFERAVSALMQRPAEICRVSKGYISEGYDADFISVDLKKVTKIRGEEMHSKCGWTPFENSDGIFPDLVYLRGQLILVDGDVASLPTGVFLNAKQQ